MATEGIYYLDVTPLSSATAIYSDIQLTTFAPNGYYSDGSITRQWFEGAFLNDPIICPTTIVPCGGLPIFTDAISEGIGYLNLDLGNDTGAVILKVNPGVIILGVRVEYNGIYYNKLVSSQVGFLQGIGQAPTYIGLTSSNCGLPPGVPLTFSQYDITSSGTLTSLGVTTNQLILSGYLQLTATAPSQTAIVIPKTAATPSVLRMILVCPCTNAIGFQIKTFCPELLSSFESSVTEYDSVAACDLDLTETYYIATVLYDSFTGTFNQYDIVYYDAYGQVPLDEGFYKVLQNGTTPIWIEVDINGVIIDLGNC